MKTSMETGTVERVGVGEESTFRIKASSKAFEILSSGLYSDKIKAILRELSINALDAHTAVNNSDPFLVHLPNQLEPYFSVRDFGTGLSHENVVTVFTTYFESTKTDNNDEVGCLGLGSKSPFAYTESYMVTSNFEGTKRIYNAFLNEQRVPSIVLMSEEKTKEGNGLEIQFPVKENDFNEFIRKTPSVFEYFKTKPDIVGAEVTHNEINYFITRNMWGVRGKDKYTRDCHGARAVMGNIAYPISDYTEDNLTEIESSILSYDIDIFFEIGDLEVAASREKLSYDTRTKKNIKKMLEVVSTEILEEIKSKVSNCTCMWDARKMVYSLRKGDYAVFSTLIEKADVEIIWKGKPLIDQLNGMGTEYVSIEKLKDCLSAVRYDESGYRKRNFKSSMIERFPVSDNLHIFIGDVKKYAKARCEQYFDEVLNSNSNNHLIVLTDLNYTDPITGKVINAVKKFKELLGMEPATTFPLLSSLPYNITSSSTGGYNPKNACGVLKYDPNVEMINGGYGQRKSYSPMWEKVSVDLDAGGVYVMIDRYKVFDGNPHYHIGPRLRFLVELGITDTVVYGVKYGHKDKVRSRKNWITLQDYCKQKFTEYMRVGDRLKLYTFQREFDRYQSVMSYGVNVRVLDWIINHGSELFGQRNEFTNVVKHLQPSKDNKDTYMELANLCKKAEDINAMENNEELTVTDIEFGGDAIKKELETDFGAAISIVKTDYPMLAHIDVDSIKNSTIETVKDYVTLVNRSIKKDAIS